MPCLKIDRGDERLSLLLPQGSTGTSLPSSCGSIGAALPSPSLRGFTGTPPCERRSARTATPLRYGLRGRPCRAVSTVDFTGESPTQGEIHGDNIYEDGYPPQTGIFPSIIKPLKMSARRMFPRSPRYICTSEVLPKDWKSEGELFKQKILQG